MTSIGVLVMHGQRIRSKTPKRRKCRKFIFRHKRFVLKPTKQYLQRCVRYIQSLRFAFLFCVGLLCLAQAEATQRKMQLAQAHGHTLHITSSFVFWGVDQQENWFCVRTQLHYRLTRNVCNNWIYAMVPLAARLHLQNR